VSYDGLRLWPLTDAARTKLKLARRDTHARHELGFSGISVAFSPDGKTIILGSDDGTVRLWDMARSSERFKLKGHRGVVHSVTFTPDVRSLLSGGADHTMRCWDLTSPRPKEMAVLTDHVTAVEDILCAPQGRYVASRGAASGISGGLSAEIRLWDFTKKPPKSRLILQSTTDIANDIDFSPNGKLFLASGGEGLPQAVGRALGRWHTPTMHLWDFEEGKLFERTSIHPQNKDDAKGPQDDLAAFGGFAPNSKSFLCRVGGAWRMWDVSTREERELGALRSDKPLVWPRLSPDGKTLAVPDVVEQEGSFQPLYYVIRLCDLNGLLLRERMQLKLKSGPISRLAFTLDGRHLLSIVEGTRLIIWSTASGQKIKEISLPGSAQNIPVMAIAPDGRHVALGNPNGTIYILRLNLLAETPATP
jgi:WD40 repeat protein